MRLSNFLLPNIGYSELFFIEKLWPEFNSRDFQKILKEFEARQRRFGKWNQYQFLVLQDLLVHKH